MMSMNRFWFNSRYILSNSGLPIAAEMIPSSFFSKSSVHMPTNQGASKVSWTKAI